MPAAPNVRAADQESYNSETLNEPRVQSEHCLSTTYRTVYRRTRGGTYTLAAQSTRDLLEAKLLALRMWENVVPAFSRNFTLQKPHIELVTAKTGLARNC